MKIEAKNITVNDIETKGYFEVEIDGDTVYLNRSHFYHSTKCDMKKIKHLICDEKTIIKNGKMQIKCDKNCESCTMHKTVSFEVYGVIPNSFRREEGHYCGRRGVYSDDITKLSKSREENKYKIEKEKTYARVEEHFKRRREKYITDETFKIIKKDIDACLDTEYGTYNEYGNHVVMLEDMDIRKTDFGYTFNHKGRIGDNGWYSTVYLHKKCNLKELANRLTAEYGKMVKT